MHEWLDGRSQSPADIAWIPKYQLRVFSPEQERRFEDGCADTDAFVRKAKQMDSFSLDMPLLFTGPSGSGKTFFARFLHDMSGSKPEKFDQVNLASIGSELAFQSFFEGHVKGAYTGAELERTGEFEEMDNGTILLDELEGLPAASQIRMLTYIEDTKRIKVRKLGQSKRDSERKSVSCSLIFATNLDIGEAIKSGKVRSDFVYRCREEVRFESLRQLFAEDRKPVPMHVMYLLYFLQKHSPPISESTRWRENTRFWDLKISPSILSRDSSESERIREFHWDGNFRTLEKYCLRLLNRRGAGGSTVCHIGEKDAKDWEAWAGSQYPSCQRQESGVKVNLPRTFRTMPDSLRQMYKQLLVTAFQLAESEKSRTARISKAAKMLGIDARTFAAKGRDLGLDLVGK